MFYGKPVLPFQFDKHFATTDLVAKVKPSRDLFNHIDSLMFNFLSLYINNVSNHIQPW